MPLRLRATAAAAVLPAAAAMLAAASWASVFSSNAVAIPELTTYVDDVVRRRLESVQGVGEARLSGGLEREVRVFLQPDRMQAVGVTGLLHGWRYPDADAFARAAEVLETRVRPGVAR